MWLPHEASDISGRAILAVAPNDALYENVVKFEYSFSNNAP